MQVHRCRCTGAGAQVQVPRYRCTGAQVQRFRCTCAGAGAQVILAVILQAVLRFHILGGVQRGGAEVQRGWCRGAGSDGCRAQGAEGRSGAGAELQG